MKVIDDLKRNFYNDDGTKPHGGKILSGIIFVLFLLVLGFFNKNQKQKDEVERKKI